jgi:thiopeptide-type bacteriocin biosynthesis protein
MWHSIHAVPKDEQDIFLTKHFLPFCEKHIWSTRGTRAFFVRYNDDDMGIHLRLRFKGEATWVEQMLKPAFEKELAKKCTQTAEVEYMPETDRFGGEAALALAEEHFHIGSRVVLSRLARKNYTYQDAMFDAMRLHVSIATAMNLAPSDARNYFENLCNEWIKAFFVANEHTEGSDLVGAVRADFQEAYEPQAAFLKDALEQFRLSLTEERHDQQQPEWLRWHKGSQIVLHEMAPEARTKALPVLLHLTNNRLGINNADEAFVLYVLGQMKQ